VHNTISTEGNPERARERRLRVPELGGAGTWRNWSSGIRIDRRGIQLVLGILWLIDGALQLQPFMFSSRFSTEVLRPTGMGQPGWVSAVVNLFAHQIGAHPVVWNLGFALIQVALGVALFLPRLVRPALLASGLWAIGVWWLGEGFGGLMSGHASLVTGAPGAVILYAVLAAAAWPSSGQDRRGREHKGEPVAAWFPLAWLTVWFGGALLQLLPGQNRPSDLGSEVSSGRSPSWLAAVDTGAAHAVTHFGPAIFVGLVTLMAAIGMSGIRSGHLRTVSAVVGIGAAATFWTIGESLGQLGSGHATDPNSGPLLIVMALALLGVAPNRSGAAERRVRPSGVSWQGAIAPGPWDGRGVAIALRRPTRGLLASLPTLRGGVRLPLAHSMSGGDLSTGRDRDLCASSERFARNGPLPRGGESSYPRPRMYRGSSARGWGRWSLGALGVLAVVATACAAASSATENPSRSAPHGMSMPAGSSMPMQSGMSMHAAGPSASARMVCGTEVRQAIATLLGLSAPPVPSSTWVHHLYTCTYRVPTGRLVLSVKDAANVPAAQSYFDALRRNLSATSTLTGMSSLGLPGYQSARGVVVFLKDDKTLEVDATSIGRTGPSQVSRSNLAYTVATDILGCWSGK
jgi:hypothetical protein